MLSSDHFQSSLFVLIRLVRRYDCGKDKLVIRLSRSEIWAMRSATTRPLWIVGPVSLLVSTSLVNPSTDLTQARACSQIWISTTFEITIIAHSNGGLQKVGVMRVIVTPAVVHFAQTRKAKVVVSVSCSHLLRVASFHRLFVSLDRSLWY